MTRQANRPWLWLALLVWVSAARAGLPIGEARPLFDIAGKGDSALSLPSDVTVAGNRVYVVDSGNQRVAVFDRKARFLFTMGEDRLKAPVGIGKDGKGRIYVADRATGRVEVFAPGGEHFRTLVLQHGDGAPARPIDVAVEPDGRRLYVTTNDRHSLLTVDARGAFTGEWGENGPEEGEFRYPGTLALLPSNRLAIVDILNTRVQLFERNGRFLTILGRWGVTPGHLFRPKGIALDREGRLLVSDSYMGVIQVFRDDGQFLHVLGSKGKVHRLGTPVGMTVDDAGRLYVARMRENRVSVFELGY